MNTLKEKMPKPCSITFTPV